MFKNIVPFVLALFVSCSLWAQIPREIQILPSSGSRSSMMCMDQDAGSIRFDGADADNQSNDVRTLSAIDPIFLCWGDQFFVQHDQATSIFQGDPSDPGVGYAFYTCKPTATGPTLMEILDDTCTLRSLNNADIPLVFTGGRTTGNARFSNEEQVGGLSLQEVYNGGDPIRFWFTPITYDNIDLDSREAIYEMDGCVNSDTAQAFSVVYLNPINVGISTGDCGGELTITGGLPEFNSSNYTVDIVNADDNTVTGSIAGVARHNASTMFTVPIAGDYIISITDNKACTTSNNEVNIATCDPTAAFNLEIPCTDTITVGNRFCLDFNVSNFDNLVSLQFQVDWDSTILDFESFSVDPALSAIGFNIGLLSSTRNDNIKLTWVSNDFTDGSTLTNNTTLFTACFIGLAEGEPNFIVRENRTGDPETEESDLGIEVTDFNGEVISFTSDLCSTLSVNPRPAAGEINVQSDITAACIGDDNGQISFSFVGGMPPYNLDLVGDNGFDESFTIFGRDTIIEDLAIGSYTYLVIDEALTAQGTNVTDPITINETDLVPRVTAVDPTCFDGLGSLTASAIVLGLTVNDLSEYTFLWDDPNATTTQTLDSIGTGTLYSVTVTNPNGCTAISNGTLSSPSQIQFNIMETPAQCSGVFDGSLTVNVDPMSGTAPYTFSWDTDPEILNSTNNVLPNLTVGDYNLTVTDDNGCTVIDDSRVSGAIEIGVDSTVMDVQCFNLANGMIQVSPAPNVSVDITNWNYAWSPNVDPDSIQSNGAISIASGLGSGTYEVILTNSDIDSQCFGTAIFEIEEPDSLMLDIDITSTSKCFRLDLGEIPDGSAVVTASGGTEDYTYVWSDIGVDDNPSANSSGITAMNLNSDTITVSVSDANGCITELDTIVSSPAPPQIISFNDDDILCADGIGSLQVLAGPGDANVTDNYIWEGPSPVPSNSALVGNLEVGTYFVTVTDDNDCITVDSAEVTAPPALDFSSFVETAPSCFGEENGAFFLDVTGGTPGYTFAWFNTNDLNEEVAGQTTSVANVPAGSYQLIGFDGNGCEIDTTIQLTSNPEIVVVFDGIMETSCALSDTPDGGATAEAIYADGTMGEFDFIWGSGERSDRVSQSTAEELGSGNISVVVFESDGVCNTTAEVFVDSPAEITYDPTNEMIDNVSCFGFNDGSISTISAASGGTPGADGFEFEWTHLPTGNNFIGEVITDLVAGDYTLVISDANDCLSSPVTRTITEPELLTAVIDTDPNNTRSVSCAGDDDGQITVIATGGNDDLGPYTYEWTNNVSVEAVATDLISNITYEIVVSDALGCEATAEFFISEPADLNPYNLDFDPIQCFGEFTTIRLDPASFSGGNGGDFTYTIDGCPERDVSEPSCQVNGGMIPITVFDSGGCAYDDVIEVDEPDQIVIDFPTAEVDGNNFVTEVQLGGEIALNAEIFNDISVPIAEVMWTDTSVVCPPLGDCRNGIVSPLDNTLYTIEVIDANGCEESASILVEVDKNRNVFIPNAFAPNSRGFDLNEDFKVYTGVGVRSINFAQVFNRWGTMVADLGVVNDPSPSGVPVWDGLLQGQISSQGVYVYIVSVTFEDNVTLLYRGDITLLR